MKSRAFVASGILAGLLALPCMSLELKTGFKGGINLSTFSGSDAAIVDDSAASVSGALENRISEYPKHLGVAGAVSLCIEFTDWVALMSELSFSQKGNIWKGEIDVGTIVNGENVTITSPLEIERRVNYFELPVMASIKPHFGAFSPFAFAGPVVSFNCFSESVTRVDGQNLKESDIKYFTYSGQKHDLLIFEAGYVAGGGIGYTIGGYEATLDARISGGVTSIIKDRKVSTSSIIIMLGILIPR
jgi:hypothetical protein